MISKILIFWYFAFPFCVILINGAKVPELYEAEVEKLDILAKNRTKINEALVLKENGFLGDGNLGIVYEGILLADNNRSVAIKFVRHFASRGRYCEREIELFCYLKAYRNESVEKYGIPVVYYYDRWEVYTLIALTKFDQDLEDIADIDKSPLDILMLFRDFVFQSKYIHSHGVRHDDVKPRNIMIRGHRSFLIDFNMSSKIMEDNCGGSTIFGCQRFKFRSMIRRPIDDWESFLYTMSVALGTAWFDPEFDNKSRMNKLVIQEGGLKKVIKAFANEVYTDDVEKEFPDYNTLEKLISLEIAKMHPNGPPKFSWVAATAEVNPVRNINDIPDPKYIAFDRYVYPHVERLPPLEQ